MRLVKQQITMHRNLIKDREANVVFTETLDEPGQPRATSMTALDWADMGMPEVVTVTIEPGGFLVEDQ